MADIPELYEPSQDMVGLIKANFAEIQIKSVSSNQIIFGVWRNGEYFFLLLIVRPFVAIDFGKRKLKLESEFLDLPKKLTKLLLLKKPFSVGIAAIHNSIVFTLGNQTIGKFENDNLDDPLSICSK